jgi:hypothetical protein
MLDLENVIETIDTDRKIQKNENLNRKDDHAEQKQIEQKKRKQ